MVVNAAAITGLVTAIVALVTAIGGVVSQVSHLSWHKGTQAPVPVPPVVAPVEPPAP